MNNETTQPLKESPTLTKIESVPTVHLVIASKEGEIMGVMGGENPLLAKRLSQLSQTEPSDFPIEKKTNLLTALGQDAYQVDRDFVLSVSGFFVDMDWKEISHLGHTLPATSVYTFVVSR